MTDLTWRKAAHDATRLPLNQALRVSPRELIDRALNTAAPLIAAAERERIAAMGERFEMAFREFVDEEEAADCALRAVEMIRGDHG